MYFISHAHMRACESSRESFDKFKSILAEDIRPAVYEGPEAGPFSRPAYLR